MTAAPTVDRQGAAATRVPPASKANLTPREVQVIRLVAAGMTSAAIGRQLGLSEHTVKSHICRMIVRTGAPNRAALVLVGLRAGIVPFAAVDVALGERERFLLALLGEGREYKAMALTCRISASSVKREVQALMRRLGARDHAHLMVQAWGAGWRPRSGGAS